MTKREKLGRWTRWNRWMGTKLMLRNVEGADGDWMAVTPGTYPYDGRFYWGAFTITQPEGGLVPLDEKPIELGAGVTETLDEARKAAVAAWKEVRR